MSITWEELPTGLVAWLHQKLGWVPVYSSLADMAPEDADVFLFLCRNDTAVETENLISVEQLAEIQLEHYKRLMPK